MENFLGMYAVGGDTVFSQFDSPPFSLEIAFIIINQTSKFLSHYKKWEAGEILRWSTILASE